MCVCIGEGAIDLQICGRGDITDSHIVYCALAKRLHAETFIFGEGLLGCTAPCEASPEVPSLDSLRTSHFANETISPVSESSIFMTMVDGWSIGWRMVWDHQVWFEGVGG